jgi:hypothetical protein
MRRQKVYEIDRVRLSDLRLFKKHTAEVLKYHWDRHSELAYQRAQIQKELQLALIQKATGPFKFEGWQRAVKYKYSLDPLDTRGSLTDPGGRFNIGAINPQHFPSFAALYIAHDKDTVVQELLGQAVQNDAHGMSSLELALTRKDSISIVQVSGELEQVINLHRAENLRTFLDLIKDFRYSRQLTEMAKKLKITSHNVIKTVRQLIATFLDPDWRKTPMLFDVPANSQIFGQIVMGAGIQGILFPSKFTDKECLAIFPQTFKNSPSHVDLVGDLPTPGVRSRIDSSNWHDFT